MNDFITPKELSDLSKTELEQLEELAKKCPRCGGSSANSGNPAGRCRKHLSKLAHDKKTPGHWQRAQTKADDALRRQKGKNGTAKKKSKGLGNRDSIVKQTQSAEKKHGQKLSPELNRGRHKVDGKKLKAWRDRMKKAEIDDELMYTALLSKATTNNNEQLVTLLRALTPAEVSQLIDNLETLD